MPIGIAAMSEFRKATEIRCFVKLCGFAARINRFTVYSADIIIRAFRAFVKNCPAAHPSIAFKKPIRFRMVRRRLSAAWRRASSKGSGLWLVVNTPQTPRS